jgi:hypothetical protein
MTLAIAAVLVPLPLSVLVPGLAHRASAQSPPSSFFEGRSNDDLRALAENRRNDILLRREAASRLVRSLADGRSFDAAEAAARDFAKNIDPAAVRHIDAVRRRVRVHLAAEGALAGTLGLSLVGLARGRRALRGAGVAVTRVAPAVSLFAVYVGLVGGYLASTYENSTPLPFILFAALLVPVLLALRAWSAVASPGLAARTLRGALAVAATIALGFLVVERVDVGFLEGIGL